MENRWQASRDVMALPTHFLTSDASITKIDHGNFIVRRPGVNNIVGELGAAIRLVLDALPQGLP
jgi:hypothetical protein